MCFAQFKCCSLGLCNFLMLDSANVSQMLPGQRSYYACELAKMKFSSFQTILGQCSTRQIFAVIVPILLLGVSHCCTCWTSVVVWKSDGRSHLQLLLEMMRDIMFEIIHTFHRGTHFQTCFTNWIFLVNKVLSSEILCQSFYFLL